MLAIFVKMTSESSKSPRNDRCVLCAKSYDEVVRIPKFLSCFHTFCAFCLQDVRDNCSIECPLCLKETCLNDGVDELQTNFDVLASKSQKSAAKRVELNYCTNCKRTAVSTCLRDHNIIDLNEDRISGPIHMQVLLFTCKTLWTRTLEKRCEVRADLDATFKAIGDMKQQVLSIKRENDRAIRELTDALAEVKKTSPIQDDPLKMLEMLDELGMDSEAADSECRAASSLSAAFESIRNSKISAVISPSDGPSTKLFESQQLAFASQGSDPQTSNCSIVLAYLVLYLRHRKELETANVNQATIDVQMVKQSVDSNDKYEKTPAKQPTRVKEVKSESVAASVGAKMKISPVKEAPVKIQKSNGAKNSNSKVAPPAKPLPSARSTKKRCFFTLSVNGRFYGKIVIQPRFDVAPIMSEKFVWNCTNKKGPSYVGSVIYGAKPMDKILGGRINGHEDIYMADRSPLKRTRGSVLLRLKRDLTKTHCFIVSSEFFILLQDKPDPNAESTVFGFVCDGLAVCDTLSVLNFSKNHVTISDAGIIV